MIKDYYKPTPVKWRKIGDALLIISTTISSFSMYENIHWLAMTSLITGVLGKLLTNFFTEK